MLEKQLYTETMLIRLVLAPSKVIGDALIAPPDDIVKVPRLQADPEASVGVSGSFGDQGADEGKLVQAVDADL